MNRLSEWLRTDIIQLRASGIGALLLTFLGASILLTTCELASNSMGDRKITPEIATIIGFGAYEGSWHAGNIVVSARDTKGRSGSAMVPPSRITGCHIGDEIRADRDNIMLYPDPEPCPIKLDPGAGKRALKNSLSR